MKIMIVDDDLSLGEVLSEALQSQSNEIRVLNESRQAVDLSVSWGPDLVLYDVNMPGLHGLEYVTKLRRAEIDSAIFLMTGEAEVRQAVEAMKLGADNYLSKPFHLDELQLLVGKVRQRRATQRQLKTLREQQVEQYRKDYLFLTHDRMQQIYEQIDQVSRQDKVTTLIMGETGTGKEHVARLIHSLSPRASEPFVEIHCGALPETLLESELFGFEAGAFTDARKSKAGLLEAAQGGTVFLDEIGEMPLATQVKLLKVLEEKKLRRLGGLKVNELDVRIIAATNRNLEKEVVEGSFRADLFYRLNVFRIELPPLRKRLEDIESLTFFFFEDACRTFGKHMDPLGAPIMDKLKSYPWPGNVRELKNVIERIVIASKSSSAGLQLLPPELLGSGQAQGAPEPASPGPAPVMTSDEAEKINIAAALKANRFNRTRTAEQLGISRRTLLNKIRRYGLESDVESPAET